MSYYPLGISSREPVKVIYMPSHKKQERVTCPPVILKKTVNLATLATTALALTAALAWNEAAKGIINSAFRPKAKDSPGPLLVYAIVVTILVIIVTIVYLH